MPARFGATVLLVVLGAPAFAAVCQDVGSELEVMVAVDQALREHLIRELPTVGKSKPHIAEQLEIVDRQNTERLKRIVERCGWPQQSVHGEKAVNDAWLLAQHADHDLQFQTRVLKLLETAVKAGEAPGELLAYLADRVATARGDPQLYGTQFEMVGECGLELRRIDSLERVEERRKVLGMPSLREYREQMLRDAMPPKCSEAKN